MTLGRVVAAATVTETDFVAALPAASLAVALTEWVPAATRLVFQEQVALEAAVQISS